MWINEDTFIHGLRRVALALPDGVLGIGDDAAVIPLNAQESYVVSKDIFLEDVHFRRAYFSPEDLAHKALHVNLSDIAAMGAKACFVLLGIGIPPDISAAWIENFSKQFTALCAAEEIFLIGGDTTASTQGFFISVTIFGHAHSAQLKYRHTARVGDYVCIIGSLGEAHAGLLALEKGMVSFDAFKDKLLHPQAKTAEGVWLGQHVEVSAMMDISDGLYIDLSRLAQASGVAGEIALEQLIPSQALEKACTTLGTSTLEHMLIGGEDYGLLFTTTPASYPTLQESFYQNFGYGIQHIGQIKEGDQVTLTKGGKPYPFLFKPFSHF